MAFGYGVDAAANNFQMFSSLGSGLLDSYYKAKEDAREDLLGKNLQKAIADAATGGDTATLSDLQRRYQGGQQFTPGAQQQARRPVFQQLEGGGTIDPKRAGRGAMLDQGVDDARYLMDTYKITPAHASGVIGGGLVESRGDPTQPEIGGGVGMGYMQWDANRWGALQRFAQATGKSALDRRTQLDFAAGEGMGAFRPGTPLGDAVNHFDVGAERAWREMTGSNDPARTAISWQHYERPRGYHPDTPERGLFTDKRVNYSRYLHGRLASAGGVSPAGGGAAQGQGPVTGQGPGQAQVYDRSLTPEWVPGGAMARAAAAQANPVLGVPERGLQSQSPGAIAQRAQEAQQQRPAQGGATPTLQGGGVQAAPGGQQAPVQVAQVGGGVQLPVQGRAAQVAGGAPQGQFAAGGVQLPAIGAGPQRGTPTGGQAAANVPAAVGEDATVYASDRPYDLSQGRPQAQQQMQPTAGGAAARPALTRQQAQVLGALAANKGTRGVAIQQFLKTMEPDELSYQLVPGTGLVEISKRTGVRGIVPGTNNIEWHYEKRNDGSVWASPKNDPTITVPVHRATEDPGYMTAAEKAQLGLPPDAVVKKAAKGSGEDKILDKGELAPALQKRFDSYIQDRDDAVSSSIDRQQLREISRRIGSPGHGATLMTTFGPWLQAAGIDVKGLSDLQSYERIFSKMVPGVREPGSGTMSDKDVNLYMKSLAAMFHDERGRELAFDTLDAMHEYKQARGQIAEDLLTRKIGAGEALTRIRALADPLARFKQFRAENPTVFTAERMAGGAQAQSIERQQVQAQLDQHIANLEKQSGKRYKGDRTKPLDVRKAENWE